MLKPKNWFGGGRIFVFTGGILLILSLFLLVFTSGCSQNNTPHMIDFEEGNIVYTYGSLEVFVCPPSDNECGWVSFSFDPSDSVYEEEITPPGFRVLVETNEEGTSVYITNPWTKSMFNIENDHFLQYTDPNSGQVYNFANWDNRAWFIPGPPK